MQSCVTCSHQSGGRLEITRSLVGKAVHGCAAALLASQAFAAGPAPLDRTILPIQEPARPLYSEIDARKVAMPPRFEVKAPDGAPNVVIVLIDDMGFGVPTTFGGPVTMPTLDSLRAGTRFSGFTAPSSPGSTRPGGSARLNRLSECSVNQRISIFGDKAKLNADGSVQVHYGGDRGSVNYLPITEGWNYVVRMYQPRKQVVDGSWKFPDAQPGR